jgi:hypothetical protein
MSDADKEKFWKEFFDSSKDSRQDTVKALADTLRVVHELRQSLPTNSPPPIGSNVLFKLAGLQMETVKKLAEISAEYTKSVGEALRERRVKADGSSPEARVLVSPELSQAKAPVTESFVIRNESSSRRVIPLPNVVHFVRPDALGRATSGGVYLAVEFNGDAKPGSETCPLPYEVKIEGQKQANVTLTIPWDARLDEGRYRGVVPLFGEHCPLAELIIELLVIK